MKKKKMILYIIGIIVLSSIFYFFGDEIAIIGTIWGAKIEMK